MSLTRVVPSVVPSVIQSSSSSPGPRATNSSRLPKGTSSPNSSLHGKLLRSATSTVLSSVPLLFHSDAPRPRSVPERTKYAVSPSAMPR